MNKIDFLRKAGIDNIDIENVDNKIINMTLAIKNQCLDSFSSNKNFHYVFA